MESLSIQAKPATYPPETAEIVQKAIAISDKPLSLPQIRKALTGPFKLDKSSLGPLLAGLLAQGHIFEWSKNAKIFLYWDRNPREPAHQKILDTLHEKPRTEQEIAREIKALIPYYPLGQLTVLLQNMMDAGELFSHPRKGNKYAFGLRPPPPDPKEGIIKELGSGPRALTDLLQALGTGPQGVARKEFNQALKELRAAGSVFASPPLNKIVLIGLTPPDPRPFLEKLRKEFDAVKKKLAPCGVADAQLFQAAREVLGLPAETSRLAISLPLPLPQRLLKLIELAADQALISLRDLRRYVGRPKQEFDAAILQLQQEQRVTLHTHDHPFGLSEDQRNDLVLDGQGRYYVGVALREGEG